MVTPDERWRRSIWSGGCQNRGDLNFAPDIPEFGWRHLQVRGTLPTALSCGSVRSRHRSGLPRLLPRDTRVPASSAPQPAPLWRHTERCETIITSCPSTTCTIEPSRAHQHANLLYRLRRQLSERTPGHVHRSALLLATCRRGRPSLSSASGRVSTKFRAARLLRPDMATRVARHSVKLPNHGLGGSLITSRLKGVMEAISFIELVG
jgi:hypothetical protein